MHSTYRTFIKKNNKTKLILQLNKRIFGVEIENKARPRARRPT